MLLHFKQRPWDLYLAAGYTGSTTLVLLALGVGSPFAIAAVLFVPGYLVAAALFPEDSEIDWLERVAISVGLSIAVISILGLVLNLTSFGISFSSMLVATGIFTEVLASVAYWRRSIVPPERRLSLTIRFASPGRNGAGWIDKGLTFAIVVSVIIAGGTISYLVSRSPPAQGFTEFYILGPGGRADGYPTNLTINQTGALIVGIVNREGAAINYTLRVDLVGVLVTYNASAGRNQTIEVNRTTWTRLNVTIADGLNWTERYSFSIAAAGLWKLQFLLFETGNLSMVYRELHLYVTVT